MLDQKVRERDLIIEATGDVEKADKMYRKRLADEMEAKVMNGTVK